MDYPPKQRRHQPTDTQRRHLRRIMWSFLIVVVSLPLAAIGGTWSWLWIIMLSAAAFAFREALKLRASVNRGEQDPTP